MKIIYPELLKIPNDEKEGINLQKRWYKRFQNNRKNEKLNIRVVTGVDISYYTQKRDEIGIACAVSWNLQEKKEIECVSLSGKIEFPYIPGLLGFRETPLIANTVSLLKFETDLLFFDGHGFAHPRFFGGATQLGAIFNIPSIGVAKSLFIGSCDVSSLEKIKGNRKEIIDSNKKVIGYASILNTRSKPVFISKGFGIDLKDALKYSTEATMSHKQPECLFLAHFYATLKKREELVQNI